MLCEYGCGQEAIYQFKNNKWCCSKNYQSCPKFIEKIIKNHAGGMHGKKHSLLSKIKIGEKSKGRRLSVKFTNEHKRKISLALIGKKLSNDHKRKIGEKSKGRVGKKHTRKSKNKLRVINSYTIEQIKEKYSLFAKIEEMRYNPENLNNEIQVHCKNHNCPNSKEHGGWFTPTQQQRYHRMNHCENGNDGSYFYCSDKCKQECPLFNLHSDPFKEIDLPYTSSEYQIWRSEVFKRQKDKFGYNFCEYCETQEDLQTHHIEPVKLQPGLSLDPENGLICCKICHLNKSHKNECSTGNLSKIVCLEE